MKKLCLPLAFLTAGCAEITDMYVPVHISANTNADIYIGSKMAGTTPAIVYLRPDGLKAEHIILKKKGFEDAKIAIDPVFKQRKTTATTWSDKRIGGYLKTKYDVHLQNVCFARGGFDTVFGFSTCAGTSFPAAFATALPASVSRYAAPYTVVEYEPRQYFVTMRPNGKATVDPLSVQIRDLILKYYPSAYSSEKESFSKFIAKATGFSENYLYWRMFDEHQTPDGAADAIAKDIERFNEIRSVLKKDLSVNKTVAALNKMTGVPEKALRRFRRQGQSRGKNIDVVESCPADGLLRHSAGHPAKQCCDGRGNPAGPEFHACQMHRDMDTARPFRLRGNDQFFA